MFNLEVGQEREFFEPTHTEDRAIPKGMRVRVSVIMTELLDEPRVTLVILGTKVPEVFTVARHVVTLHSRLV